MTTVILGVFSPSLTLALEPSLSAALKNIARADGEISSDQAASQAVEKLQSLPSDQVTEILKAFSDASKRGRNWLRALAADVSDNGSFPESELRQFFDDRSNDSDARYVSFQLLTQNDAELQSILLAEAETDPSLPVRYLKIQSMIDQAGSVIDEKPVQAKRILQSVVQNGRSPKQLETAVKILDDLGVEIDLADELGMLRQWWVIGPFDNTDSANFDTAYVPENRYLESGTPLDAESSGAPKPEQGKDAAVQWQRIESDDSLGMVDLNGPLSNEKDAAAYVFTRFKLVDPTPDLTAEARLGCITANKVWINGKLVTSNEVYHSGTRIDQYVAQCELAPGENTVMIKVMQNAQTQSWAQDWQFQFRLTHLDGSVIKTKPIE